MPSCWPSPWSGTCWAGAARPGSSPRGPATGATCSRCYRTQSEANRRTRWLWGAFEQLRGALAARLPEATASRSIPGRPAGQAPAPGLRPGPLDRARQRPGRPVRPRRRPWRMVLRVPPGRQDGPGQPDRARLGHRARRGGTSARPPRTCWKPGSPRVTCWRTRASAARPSPPHRRPAAPCRVRPTAPVIADGNPDDVAAALAPMWTADAPACLAAFASASDTT